MRLGFICEPLSNSYYRAIFPLRALEQRGHTVLWPADLEQGVALRELLSCDLVHCYRRMDRIEDLRTLAKRGVAVSFDNDDNYAASEISEEGSGIDSRLTTLKHHRASLEMAKLADLTTTPNALLADIYRAAGASEVAVIGNHLSRGMFGFGCKSDHEGVVLGWIAKQEHSLDVKEVPIVAALNRLLEAHPDLRILTVGLRLPIAADRYEYIEEIEFHELLTVTGRMDIGIAPLADTTFNRSRSDSKLKEYSSGGAAWLASPVGPYRDLGEAQGGQLVGDDDWFPAIDALIGNARQRKRLSKRALKWAKAETIDKYVSSWETHFTAAIARAEERMGSSRAPA